MDNLTENLVTIFLPFLGKAALAIIIIAAIVLIPSVIVHLIRRKKS